MHTCKSKDPRMENGLHVVLGAGQIGTSLVEALVARGEPVRQVRKGAFGAARAGVETASGDLSDPGFAAKVLAGAKVAYHCVNAPYHEWLALLPALQRGIVEGAARAGTKLVVLDNLYPYGKPKGPLREDTPPAPCSRKGEIRAKLAEELSVAHASGRARIVIVRASDFFGPHVTRTAVFGDRFYSRVLAGKNAEAIGDPDLVHDYAYGPDVARAMLALGGAGDDVLGQVWHVPSSWTGTTRELVTKMVAALGGKPGLSRLPAWLLHGLGVFIKEAGEVPEMIYQWEAPFTVDASKIRARLGFEATPIDEAIRATTAWARGAYGRKAAA